MAAKTKKATKATKAKKTTKKGSKKAAKSNEAVTRVEFAKDLAQAADITVTLATTVYNEMFDLLRGYVAAGRKVVVQKFGKFQSKDRAARPGFNPIAMKHITVKACKTVSFKASNDFKAMVNGK